jgi:AcrR family transcriptional regulator
MPATRSQRRRMPRQEREQQMLETAHALFAARGFAAVTMDEVAEAVGVTKPLLYTYWGNKEQLFLACLDRSAEALFERLLTAVRAADDPALAVADAVGVFFTFVDEERAAWQVVFDPTSPLDGQIAERVSLHRARLAGLLAEAFLARVPDRHRERVRTEVEGRSHAVLGAAEALARWWLRTGALTAGEAAQLLIETVVPGLSAGTRKEDEK